MVRKNKNRIGLLTALCLISMFSSFSFSGSTAEFGSYGQETYQNSWQDTIDQAYDFLTKFNNKLDDTDTKLFYWNLVGAKDEFETSNDQNGLETVDLVMIYTHGSVTSTAARWCMYENETRAYTSNMCLGNESDGLRIFASYSCHTLQSSDNHMKARWYPTFSCGMQYALGSHDILNNGNAWDECGREFADSIQEGDTFKYAWRDALNETGSNQDVSHGGTR